MTREGLIKKIKSLDYQIQSFEVEIKSKRNYLQDLKSNRNHIKNLLKKELEKENGRNNIK